MKKVLNQKEISKNIRDVMERADITFEEMYTQPEEKNVLLMKEYISQIAGDKRSRHGKNN